MTSIDDIIYAPSTGQGGAISVIRLSGKGCHKLADGLIHLHRGSISEAPGFSIRYGEIPELDDVLVSIFKGPKSYTGDDMVEISCHASPYVVGELMHMLSEAGARLAEPGEFTRRAFLSGKIDLAQAEAVADIISSSSKAQHRLALNQLNGGFSKELADIRDSLLELTALLELELDFSEEDVQFADRNKLRTLANSLAQRCSSLAASFRVGNAVKNGVPVAIIGAPNSGKSTLLNTLLNDDRAIVSDVPGTTRDTVEETSIIDGVLFRFIDTAGIRSAEDEIEKMGIERTLKKTSQASIVLGVIDASEVSQNEKFISLAKDLAAHVDLTWQKLIILANKMDLETVNKNVNDSNIFVLPHDLQVNGVTALSISAKTGFGLDKLHSALVSASEIDTFSGTLVTNARHANALSDTASSLSKVCSGLDSGEPSDIIAEDLRSAINSLGTITGQITNNEVLGQIFSRFCIGK